MDTEAEGTVARRVLQERGTRSHAGCDDRSRDTAENATRMAALLARDGVRTIALVTDATHMQRAAAAFPQDGLDSAAGTDNLPGRAGAPPAGMAPFREWFR
jgi:uncharacterized SAM-binding protein YcdF (DUF218 family)